MNAAKECLIAARRLIQDREHWTQGDHAIESTGRPVDPMDDEAYAFCVDGACARAAGGFESALYAEMIEALDASTARMYGFYGQWAVVRVNDCEIGDFVNAESEVAHAAVLAIIDDAIRSS